MAIKREDKGIYTPIRCIVNNNGVYLNAQDLIRNIEIHKERVGYGAGQLREVYRMAHDHIIDIIEIHSNKEV